MAKTMNAGTGKLAAKGGEATVKLVRSPKTGRFVAVKGVGALKDRDLTIRKGLSLTEPIAEQALFEPSDKRKAG